MSILSDHIESFIKELLVEDEGTTELQRNELAHRFHCAPSQINYVLTTRFSFNRGYSIESRRGGGGYIRVIQLNVERTDYIAALIDSELKNGINRRQAAELIEGLYETGFIDVAAKEIILAAVSDAALKNAGEQKEELRASILREILVRTI